MPCIGACLEGLPWFSKYCSHLSNHVIKSTSKSRHWSIHYEGNNISIIKVILKNIHHLLNHLDIRVIRGAKAVCINNLRVKVYFLEKGLIVKPKSKVPKSRPKGLGLTLKAHGPPTNAHARSKLRAERKRKTDRHFDSLSFWKIVTYLEHMLTQAPGLFSIHPFLTKPPSSLELSLANEKRVLGHVISVGQWEESIYLSS